jgi:uncharacterized repeat protein (TIGR03803 family)
MKCSLGKLACVVFVCSAIAVSVSTAQTLATIVNFNGANGTNPHSSLLQGTDGNFYGTTYNGGFNNHGTIFRITSGGALTLLHSFGNADGARPWSGLIQGSDGNFYGTTSLGGVGGGTVFQMNPSGFITTLHKFGGTGSGTIPYGGLVQGTDGAFYGTTSSGGANGFGTIFKVASDGTFTSLHDFTGADGANPYATLIQGTDGNFYGTTLTGGASNSGTVFQATPDGTVTTLYSFSGSDGLKPYSSVVQGSDGNFYGTTSQGGSNNNGTVFQLTAAGVLTTLHSFCSPSSCSDGSIPYAGLVQAPDGSFFGAASGGGQNSAGTIFKITSAGVFTTLHPFTGIDGRTPYSNLIIASNGELYGTTYNGGSGSLGVVFAVSPVPYRFVAVPPCRVLDTRNGSPIQGGTAQTFDLRQLSQNNGCGDLSAANLYSLNVTLVPTHGPVGYLTIWPAGQAQPVVSTMNSLDGRVKANAAIVTGGTNGAVSIYVSNTTDVVLDINGYFSTVSQSTLAFYPLPPCRLVDTRNPNGPLGGPFLQGQQERDFPLLAGNCHIPNNALAYSLNFTAVPYQNHAMGFLTVWPKGGTRPVVSTLNNTKATIVANAAMVTAGTSGQVAVYPSDNTDLVVDINGYFAASGSGGLSLYPVSPCRVLDTRSNNGQPFQGTLDPPVDVVDAGCIVPASAQSYVLNATVVPAPKLSFLTLWAFSSGQPTVSTLNASDGWITSNMAVVPAFNGKINAYASDPTQLILDISSYFAP